MNEDKFNESLAKCSTEQERQQLITETLNGLYSDAANKYRETNKEVMDANRAQSDYADTMASFGEKVEPITTSVKEGFNGLLQKVLELTEGVDFAAISESISSAFSVLSDTVIPAVVSGFDKLKSAWQWIKDNKEMVIVAVTGLAAGFAVLESAQIAATIASTASKIATGLQTAQQWLLNAAMNANPMGLIVIAITALVAAFMYLWNNCESFRNFFVNMWDNIKNAASVVVDWFKSAWQSIGDFFTVTVPGWFNSFKEFFVNLWETIKEKTITPIIEAKEKVAEIFTNIKESIQEKIEAAKEIVTSIFDGIKNDIQNKIETAKNIIQNVLTAIKSIFTGDFGAAKNAVLNIFDSISTGIKNKIENAKKTVTDVVEKIKGVFNFKWSLPSLKIPKITVTGGVAPYGIAGQGSLPKFSITWNAKGGLFTKPTVLQGFGEAGHEYAIPLNERSVAPLAAMINKLTAANGGGLSEAIASRFDMAVDKLADRLERLEMAVNIDGERVATATATYSDAVGGTRYELINRGLAIE